MKAASRRREAHESGRAFLIDPTRHPELAAAQFRIIASQLQMLVQAAGADTLRARLEGARVHDREWLLGVLGAIERGPDSRSSDPASPLRPGH